MEAIVIPTDGAMKPNTISETHWETLKNYQKYILFYDRLTHKM